MKDEKERLMAELKRARRTLEKIDRLILEGRTFQAGEEAVSEGERIERMLGTAGDAPYGGFSYQDN